MKNKRTLILTLLLAGLALILITFAIKGWRSYQAVQSLLTRQAQAQDLLAGGFTNVDPEQAEALVYGLREDVVILRNETRFLMPLMPYLGWLPKAGPLAEAAPKLMEMADAGTEAAAYAFRGLKPALFLLQEDPQAEFALLPEILQILDTAKPDLAQANLSFGRLIAAREALGDTADLPWRVRTLLDQADPWLPRGQAGMQLALIMPTMLGQDGPKRYLILAQNEDELRPTGGFISGAGLLEIANGEIVNLAFEDANLVDAWAVNEDGWYLTKPYDSPPQPLTDFMLLELFLFRDANFWPDFPQSAQQAIDLYRYGQERPPVDGAIAIDQQFLKLLVEAIGAVTIPDTGEVISSSNIIESLQNAWNLEGQVTERKAFLEPFAVAILDRIQGNLGTVAPLLLVENIFKAVEGGHLQIYMQDPIVASGLRDMNWDGRLPRENIQDYLLVVDTNMGYNKSNLFINQAIRYDVALENTGAGQANLVVTHSHMGQDDGEPCYQGSDDVYIARAGYTALADKCYWNYLRVYAPAGSELQSGPQHIVPDDSWYGDFDWEPTHCNHPGNA